MRGGEATKGSTGEVFSRVRLGEPQGLGPGHLPARWSGQPPAAAASSPPRLLLPWFALYISTSLSSISCTTWTRSGSSLPCLPNPTLVSFLCPLPSGHGEAEKALRIICPAYSSSLFVSTSLRSISSTTWQQVGSNQRGACAPPRRAWPCRRPPGPGRTPACRRARPRCW